MHVIGWDGSDVFCEMANLDELLDIAYMGFLSQEWVTGHCPLNDFATRKAAICQDLVIIMVIQDQLIELPLTSMGSFWMSFTRSQAQGSPK